MINVLVVGLTQNSGGMESFLYNYISKLNSSELHFDFLCYGEQIAYKKEFSQMGCIFYRMPIRRKSPLQYYRELESFFKKNAKKYNVIWQNDCNLIYLDFLKWAKKYGIPFRIIHSHNSQNMNGKLKGIIHLYHKKKIGKIATNFWACSRNAGKWFYNDKILASSQYLLVQNAIDSSKYQFSEEYRRILRKDLGCEDKLVIGNVGRLHFQKNQDFLLDIFYEIQKEIQNSCLILVGQGSDENMLRKKSKDLEIQDKIIFLGVRKDIGALLSVMDIFVFPSIFEGLPIALLEAQASGLPVIASDKVIPHEVKISDSFQFISLNESAREWSKIVLKFAQQIKNEKPDRVCASEQIRNSGYDIYREANKLKEIFLSFH